MRAHKYPPPSYTVAEYQKWEGDWELIDGYPYAMNHQGTFSHQNVVSEISFVMRGQLKRLQDGSGKYLCIAALDWVLDEHNVIRPDVAIVGEQMGDYITKPPIFIVEVTSPATTLKDRKLKYQIYEEQGVPYYIIIDPETKQYNTFVLNNGTYQERNDTTTFAIGVQCAIELHLEELLADI